MFFLLICILQYWLSIKYQGISIWMYITWAFALFALHDASHWCGNFTLAALVSSFWCGSIGHVWSHCFRHHLFAHVWQPFCCVQEHIFKLMKSDSYSRYLRSDQYKEYLSGTRKKVRHLPGIYSDWAIFKHWLAFTMALTNLYPSHPQAILASLPFCVRSLSLLYMCVCVSLSLTLSLTLSLSLSFISLAV